MVSERIWPIFFIFANSPIQKQTVCDEDCYLNWLFLFIALEVVSYSKFNPFSGRIE